MNALLLDLVCNRALNALDLQAITYFNVLAGRTGSMGLPTPASDALPFYQRHLDDIRGLDLVQLGRDGMHMRVEGSRFAGDRVQSQDGSWRAVEPYTLTSDGSAIIHVVGALVNRGAYVGANSGVTSYEGIDFSLGRAAASDRVKSIVIDVSSPGGESAGNTEIADKIRAIRQVKPVYGIGNGLAASAGYCILSACTEAYATPSALVGSIGVIMLHLDKTEQAKTAGVVPTIIYAGSNKADGHAFKSLDPDALDRLKAGVNSYYDLFVKSVGAGRGEKLTSKMARATEAATFVGKEAKTAGLLDDLATFDDVIAASDAYNRRRSRRSASSKEGSQGMSSLVAQFLGTTAPTSTAPGPAAPAAEVPPRLIDGVWFVPQGAVPAGVTPQSVADPRVAQAQAHPLVIQHPAILGTVLGYLQRDAQIGVDMAIGLAVGASRAAQAMPAAHTLPAIPAPPAPVATLPPCPQGYAWAIAPNGTAYMIQAQAMAAPGPAAVTPGNTAADHAALRARVDATGAVLVPAGLGVTPGGQPVGQGFAPAGGGPVDTNKPGSITVEMAKPGWEQALNLANGRAASFQKPVVTNLDQFEPAGRA